MQLQKCDDSLCKSDTAVSCVKIYREGGLLLSRDERRCTGYIMLQYGNSKLVARPGSSLQSLSHKIYVWPNVLAKYR